MKRSGVPYSVVKIALAFGLAFSTLGWAGEVPDVNPFSGNQKAIKSGRSWYQNLCGPCHGATANGAGERGQGADLRKLKIGFKGYVETVKNGRTIPGQSLAMPAWGGAIDDNTIYEMGAYLETLANEEANWKAGAKKE